MPCFSLTFFDSDCIYRVKSKFAFSKIKYEGFEVAEKTMYYLDYSCIFKEAKNRTNEAELQKRLCVIY